MSLKYLAEKYIEKMFEPIEYNPLSYYKNRFEIHVNVKRKFDNQCQSEFPVTEIVDGFEHPILIVRCYSVVWDAMYNYRNSITEYVWEGPARAWHRAVADVSARKCEVT